MLTLSPGSTGIQLREVRATKVQVTLTRTDTGATTKIGSDSGESSKEYSSWNDALIDAEHIGLVNGVESTAAKSLPPGFPLHTNAELDLPCLATRALFPGRHRQHDNFVSALLSRRQTAARLSPLVYRFYSRAWFAIPCRDLMMPSSLRSTSSEATSPHRSRRRTGQPARFLRL
jgi:hypothetical protein